MARTFADFWTMISQEQVETIVCLLADAEMVGKEHQML